MFENLLSFWKGKDFLAQVLGDFKAMLDDAEIMFKSAVENLFAHTPDADIGEKIYEIDKKINQLQKDVRQRIITHLSLQPSVDVTACLLLMSVVKDAERLGDYSKNLYQVRKLTKGPLGRATFSGFFDELDGQILSLFAQTKEAFIESNELKAQSSWDYEHKIAKRCDDIILELAESSLSVSQAVAYTLIARHFKRIVAHLVNIATSVILPLSHIDYFDESTANE